MTVRVTVARSSDCRAVHVHCPPRTLVQKRALLRCRFDCIILAITCARVSGAGACLLRRVNPVVTTGRLALW